MAGGTWKSQNKVRPGAYINFKAVPMVSSSIGERGVMTMPVAMDWGPQNQVIELLSTDLLDGKSLAKIGYGATDLQSQIFRLALGNCSKALIYRLDTGGAKATASSGNLTIVAKYAGVAGNRISVAIVENANDPTMWDVVTFFKNAEKHRQTVLKTADASVLEDNEWVDFSGADALTANAGITLANGTNGTISADTYTADNGYFNAVMSLNWNTMAIPQTDDVATSAVKDAAVALVRTMREDEGKKVQVVLHNVDTNYEGVISVEQGFKTDAEVVTPAMCTAYVAGLTAGSNINASNTYKVVDGAVEIVYPEGVKPYNHSEIVAKLNAGKFIFTTRQDGAVVIEQDINTLHSPYPSTDVNYTFSKNRVIRALDQINNDIALKYQASYIGKVDNNEDGRNLFKADCISYLTQLQRMNVIQNFNSETDITVSAGEAIDAVVVDLAIQPVDSMEKLYMTVMVG